MASKRQDAVVEVEEQLLCSGEGETSWRMEVEDWWGCLFFLFLVGLNPTSLNPTLSNPDINRAQFLEFGGGIYITI
jgi:hypothetical protein